MKRNFDYIYNDLKNKYEDLLKSSWQETQNGKKQFKSKFKKINFIALPIIIIISLAFILFISMITNGEFSLDIIFTLLGFIFPLVIFGEVILLFVLLAIYLKKYFNYNNEFKEHVINDFLNNFYTEVNYMPKQELPINLYKDIYNDNFNKYQTDDYIEAKINHKYNVKMAEVETKISDSESFKTVFHGMFAMIELDKTINTSLEITQNNDNNLSDKVLMDSNEFEQYFNVSCKDQIMAMRILTHDLMRTLVDFNQNNIDFDVKIYGNIVYLRFNTGIMFETFLFNKTSIDEKMIRRYYDILEFIEQVTNEIIKAIEQIEI